MRFEINTRNIFIISYSFMPSFLWVPSFEWVSFCVCRRVRSEIFQKNQMKSSNKVEENKKKILKMSFFRSDNDRYRFSVTFDRSSFPQISIFMSDLVLLCCSTRNVPKKNLESIISSRSSKLIVFLVSNFEFFDVLYLLVASLSDNYTFSCQSSDIKNSSFRFACWRFRNIIMPITDNKNWLGLLPLASNISTIVLAVDRDYLRIVHHQ